MHGLGVSQYDVDELVGGAVTRRCADRFTRATFDGRLRITDLTAFRRTLTHGLGKSKAYGCGLMTLAPVR